MSQTVLSPKQANRSFKPFSLSFLFPLLFILFSPSLFSAEPAPAADESSVLKQYEEVMKRAQSLNVYREDILHVVPKMEMAGQAIMSLRYEDAGRFLAAADRDLDLLETQMPVHSARTFRLEWLEIYREIFQKFAILAILAFFFVKIPSFHRWLKSEQFPAKGKMYLVILCFVSALFFSFFDISRYGEAAWAFFDVQVVFITLSGLLGGVWCGVATGFFVGVFRLILSADYAVYAAIAVAAGTIGGLGGRYISSFTKASRVSFAAGTLSGLFHGTAIYIPSLGNLPWTFVLMSIFFLAVLEGAAVFVFMAVVSGLIHEEKQRDVEKELLTTKLLFLQAQIRPHFLFNSLNTIAAVCSKEKAPQAHRLILRLAEFLRQAAKRFDDHISLKEELSYVDAYLDLEKARFQERLQIEKKFDIPEEVWNLKIPFLIIQPLVENAVKHGISRKPDGGRVTIMAEQKDGHLVIEVKDDGTGVLSEKIEKVLSEPRTSQEEGVGLRNINQRLIHLFGPKYGLQFNSRLNEGTSVWIRIPMQEG